MAHIIEWKPYGEPGWTEIYVDGTLVGHMHKRPAHCDRGHWSVSIQYYSNMGELQIPQIDHQDGFPRYYMREEVAKSETEAFLRWRLWRE